jgi:Holliday junction DNA helicase RuvA
MALLIKSSENCLAILSGMSADQFVSCVIQDDLSTIVKIPGVGKKTAERLLIEMRDKLKDWQTDSSDALVHMMPTDVNQANTFVSDNKGDAINALVSLGYSQQQADKAVKSVFEANKTSEDLIRNALKAML